MNKLKMLKQQIKELKSKGKNKQSKRSKIDWDEINYHLELIGWISLLIIGLVGSIVVPILAIANR